MIDDFGNEIMAGDILASKWGFFVVVVEGETGLVGKLICDPVHSCANTSYDLSSSYRKIDFGEIDLAKLAHLAYTG